MGYSRGITAKVEALYGKYFDLIVDIPAGQSITFPFPNSKLCQDARYHIYNWMSTNFYSGYYSLKWGDEDHLSLIVTNNTRQRLKFPSPGELQHYLYSLPSEIWFEATLKFLSTFELYPQNEIDRLQWIDPKEDKLEPTTKPKADNIFDEIFNIKEDSDA